MRDCFNQLDGQVQDRRRVNFTVFVEEVETDAPMEFSSEYVYSSITNCKPRTWLTALRCQG